MTGNYFDGYLQLTVELRDRRPAPNPAAISPMMPGTQNATSNPHLFGGGRRSLGRRRMLTLAAALPIYLLSLSGSWFRLGGRLDRAGLSVLVGFFRCCRSLVRQNVVFDRGLGAQGSRGQKRKPLRKGLLGERLVADQVEVEGFEMFDQPVELRHVLVKIGLLQRLVSKGGWRSDNPKDLTGMTEAAPRPPAAAPRCCLMEK